MIRYGNIAIGDRLTDNSRDPDDYRYHDVFHMAYAVFLGWSPVTRALLKVKRKSDPLVDEAEDGARAIAVEEAVSALVFARAKTSRHFEGVDQLDYDLLKTIESVVRGLEVARVPTWQWETAILEGFRIFRDLRRARGGRVSWNLDHRTITWQPPGGVDRAHP